MSMFQVLLALSGSRSAECAAELSWEIARQANGNVIAQHVVDTTGASRLINCPEPGLIGSGLYAHAYDNVLASLNSIASKLSEKYEALYTSNSMQSPEILITEGDPLKEVLKRAEEHDLVVAGKPSSHYSQHGEEEEDGKKRLSEELASKCPVPLILVDRSAGSFSKLKILVSAEQEDVSYVRECMKFAKKLGNSFELIIIYTPDCDAVACQDIGLKLKIEIPEIAEAHFKLRVLDDGMIPNAVSLWKHCHCNLNIHVSPSALMVVPTRLVGDKRMTIFGLEAGEFMRRTMTSSVLFWPEEYRTCHDDQEESRVISKLKTAVETNRIESLSTAQQQL